MMLNQKEYMVLHIMILKKRDEYVKNYLIQAKDNNKIPDLINLLCTKGYKDFIKQVFNNPITVKPVSIEK